MDVQPYIFTRYVTGTEAHNFKTRLSVTQLQIKRKNSHDNYKLAIFKCMHKAYNGRLPSRLLHKLLGNFLATFGLSSNFWATYGLEHFFGNLWSFEHFFGNFFQSEKIYPFLVTKISFLCISSLTKRINIHVNLIVRLYWLQVTSDYCHQWVPCHSHVCSVLC